jgi:hypothetical protein
MFNPFNKKQSVLEEMAAEVEEQPSLLPEITSPPPPMPACKPPKEEKKVCPDCGTTDCISLKEYQKRIKVENNGFSINPIVILQCCNARQQMNKIREIKTTGSMGPK